MNKLSVLKRAITYLMLTRKVCYSKNQLMSKNKNRYIKYLKKEN